MTAGIEVCTTIAKAGSVIDFYSGMEMSAPTATGNDLRRDWIP